MKLLYPEVYLLLFFMVSADQFLQWLWVLAAVMIIIVLYHTLFIVVDLRKILRRVDVIGEQIEDIIMKPISMADTILSKILEFVEQQEKKKKILPKKSSKK